MCIDPLSKPSPEQLYFGPDVSAYLRLESNNGTCNRVTVVAQCAKAPGIHGYVVGPIPAVTPKYCTVTTINALRSTKKKKFK